MTSLRKLGSSDLEVFPLALGGNVFGWTADEARSFAVLDAYTAAGGNAVGDLTLTDEELARLTEASEAR